MRFAPHPPHRPRRALLAHRAPACPILGREAPKFDKPCFITMQLLQAKLGKSFAQFGKEPLGPGSILETYDTVIREADDYCVTSRMSTSPFLDPQVNTWCRHILASKGLMLPP